jgi:hypothetical protein
MSDTVCPICMDGPNGLGCPTCQPVAAPPRPAKPLGTRTILWDFFPTVRRDDGIKDDGSNTVQHRTRGGRGPVGKLRGKG